MSTISITNPIAAELGISIKWSGGHYGQVMVEGNEVDVFSFNWEEEDDKTLLQSFREAAHNWLEDQGLTY